LDGYHSLPSRASNTNVIVSGQVTDNLSGVASLQVQVDGGAYAPLTFDAATGHFSFTTSFPLDGSADGSHTINFQATDNADNLASPVAFTFTLATQAPTLTLTSPTDGGTLSAGTTLTGTVTTSGGANVVSLRYAFDGSTTMIPVAFSPDGTFSQALDLSKLATGSHTLLIAAQDAAGNTTSQTLHLSLATAIPLTVSSFAPSAGSTDVGVTFRPEVFFSRPIDTSTLNSSNFYATDTTGAVIPATIVPSADGTYAWLFFTNPMPGASTITLVVDGSTIKATDGSLLDAAGNGTPGSELTSTFTTVSSTPLPGTTLSGILVDPGPDDTPGTRDDVRVGNDGVLGTADDVYLRPIAGVEVYILGLENEAVYTDSQGRFTLTNVPSGDVKLAIEGNVPGVQVYDPNQQQDVDPNSEGFYFPQMVMDLTIKPDVANTVMGTMGTNQEQAANATNLGVYLPRVPTSILQTASDTQPTTVGVSGASGLGLTPQQQQELTLTVQPGSAIGLNGQPLSSFQIGISTVPTALIKDMLPTGVPQPIITITVQAPGVATFSTPVALTFPNVYNAAPGTKLNFISFDHTTGRLEIEGTATVSADGLSVVTDPGVGVTHPGWHFVAQGSLNQDRVRANGDSVNDLTKFDFNNLTELAKEYPNDVDPQTHALTIAAKIAAEAKVAVARAGLNAIFDFKAATELGHFIDPTNPLADNNAVRDELASDANFQTLNKQLQAALKQDVLAQKDAANINIDLNSDLQRLNAAFIPAGSDAGYIWGRIQAVSVTGEGDITPDGSDITGQLHYTFSVEYGFGTNDATSSLRTWFSKQFLSAARELQLAGIYAPFPLSVTITTMIGSGQDPPPVTQNTSAPTMSTVSGFGSDTSIYYRFDFADGFAITGKTDSLGNLGTLVFTPNTQYTGTFYSPSTNTWGSIIGVSGASGQVFGFDGADSTIDLNHFGGIDSTGDGLPDIARYVIGLKVGVRSFAGDGIDDATKLAEGLDPLSGKAFPTGIVATLPLSGGAQEIALTAKDAYLTTASGMAIVDTTQFDKPILLSQIALAGTPTDVAVDSNLQIAAVATGNSLQLVNVATPTTPTLVQNVAVAATRDVVFDGVAYATSGTTLTEVDLLTGKTLQALTLPGSGTVTGLAREGTMLYAFVSGSGTFLTIDISTDGKAAVLGQLSVAIASFDVGVSVGNGVAWLAGSGLRTVDISDPRNPTLIHDADLTFTSQRIALNGSGLGVLSPDGNSYLEVYDTSDPNATDNRLLQIPLSGGANDVAIGRGIAYVADGAGLEVVNYLPFDTKGIAPTINLDTTNLAPDPTLGGFDAIEGSPLTINATISDDVQVSEVDLLVNGQVVKQDVSFPFDLSTYLPTIVTAGNTVTVQVSAIDTGGNTTTTNPIVFHLQRDTTPPSIVQQYPPDGSTTGPYFRTIVIDFSKPLDPNSISPADFELTGPAGTIGVESVELRMRNSEVSIALPPGLLAFGDYTLVIHAAMIADMAGNALGSADLTTTFQVAHYSKVWTNLSGGNWSDPTNWSDDRVPGPGDDVLIDVPGNPTIVYDPAAGETEINSLISADPFEITGGTLTVDQSIEVDNTFVLAGGTLADAVIYPSSAGQAIVATSGTLDGVTLDSDLTVPADIGVLNISDGLTLNSILTVGDDGWLYFNGTQSLAGSGQLVLNGDSTRVFLSGSGAPMTLTVGAGMTIHGVGLIVGSYGNEVVDSQGTIEADQAGSALEVSPPLINQGVLATNGGGELDVDKVAGGAGKLNLSDPGSAIVLDGSGYTIDEGLTAPAGTAVTLRGTWTNAAGSAITVDGATLDLLGPFLIGAAATSVTGGGGTLNDWSNAGTITASGGATVNLGGNFTLSSLGSFTRSNDSTVTLIGTLNLLPLEPTGLSATAGADFIVLGWSDNSAVVSGYSIERSTDGVNFSQIGTVAGDVTSYVDSGLTEGSTYYYRVVAYDAVGDSPYSNIASAVPGEFGAGLLVSYYVSSDLSGTVVTSRVESTASDSWFSGSFSEFGSARWLGRLQPQFSETYTFTAQAYGYLKVWVAGQLVVNTLDGDPANAQVTLTAGQTYDLRVEYETLFPGIGEFGDAQLFWTSPSTPEEIVPGTALSMPTSTGLDLGTNVPGPAVTTLGGGTLLLDTATGNWNLLGGTIAGGTVISTDGTKLVATQAGGTLDGVTVDADIDLAAANASLSVDDGLTLNGTADLGDPNSPASGTLTFNGDQTLAGTGRILFGQNGLLDVVGDTVLTIGPGITIDGGSGNIGSGSGTLVNEGTIAADGVGAFIAIDVASFQNVGTLRVAPGAVLSVTGDFTQAATGMLNIQIAGTEPDQFGQFAVGGTATLDGTLNISFVNGFIPTAGDIFEPITYGTISGSFSTVIGQGIAIEYDPSDVILTGD
jgi:hypothetical protein